MPSSPTHLSVKPRRRVRRPEIFQKVRQREQKDRTIVSGIPVAIISWVIAEIVGSGTDVEHVHLMLDDARHERIEMGNFRDQLDRSGGIGRRTSRNLR